MAIYLKDPNLARSIRNDKAIDIIIDYYLEFEPDIDREKFQVSESQYVKKIMYRGSNYIVTYENDIIVNPVIHDGQYLTEKFVERLEHLTNDIKRIKRKDFLDRLKDK